MRTAAWVIVIMALGYSSSALLQADDTTVRRLAIPAGAPVRADFVRELHRFHQNEIELLAKHNKNEPSTRSLATNFLNESNLARCAAGKPSAEQIEQRLQMAGGAAREPRHPDPLVCIHYAEALVAAGRYPGARTRIEMAIQLFQTSEYPRGLQWMPLLLRRRLAAQFNTSKEPPPVLGQLHEAASAWFSYAQTVPKSERVAWHLYTQGIDRHVAQAQASLQAYGQLPEKNPWIWEMLQGKYEYDYAAHLRGEKPSHEVPPEQWQQYVRHCNLASQHFRKAHELRPDFPEAATVMITLARDGHDLETAWDWFARAVAAEADHMPAYLAMLDALHPNYGGSFAEMLAFGESCARTQRYDTDVPYIYVLACRQAREDREFWMQTPNSGHRYDKLEWVLARLLDHPARQRQLGQGQLGQGASGYSEAKQELWADLFDFATDGHRLNHRNQAGQAPQNGFFPNPALASELQTDGPLPGDAAAPWTPERLAIHRTVAADLRGLVSRLGSIDQWIRELGNDSYFVREAATRHLIELPICPRAQLIQRLRDPHPDPEVRFRARLVLGQSLDHTAEIEELVRQVWQGRVPGMAGEICALFEVCDTPRMRSLLDLALAATTRPGDEPALSERLQSANPIVRTAAVTALARLATSEAIAALLAHQEEADVHVLANLGEGLTIAARREGLPILIALLTSDDEQIRTRSALALQSSTGIDHGFFSTHSHDQRAAVANQWRSWLAAHGDFTLRARIATVRAIDPFSLSP